VAQDFDDLIADLDAAKAGLARSVKRCRNFFGERRIPPVTVAPPEESRSAFGWDSPPER
jgi:hypothetical protein